MAIAGTVAALAATVFLFGGVFSGGSEPARSASPLARPAGDALDALQARVRRNPGNTAALTDLGLAYQQRARETGDAAYYPKAEGVLRRALRLDRRSPLAISGLGSLALARHRFREALRLGRRAVALERAEGRHWGVVGDALVELGRYGEAFRAFDRMASLQPGVSSYSRISYARELLGRPRAALTPMRLAVEAAGIEPEVQAWTRVQLGKLYWSLGRLEAAAREYRLALAALPGYVHALDALAQVEAAQGHLARAIALERRAAERMPLPQFVAALGDLYRAAGMRARARDQYALVDVERRLLEASGVRTDLEIALFDVDHGVRLRQALALARSARAARPSIDGDDVLAWSLMRNGRCDEALRYSTRALRLGTKDALKLFHRGMIERCLGRRAAARTWFRRALALNPHFSVLWSPVARRFS